VIDVTQSRCVVFLSRDVALWKVVMNLLLVGLNLFTQSGYMRCLFVGPRPSFEKTLVRVGPILDFETMVEDGAPRRSRDRGSHRICGLCKGLFRVFIMGYGMSAHGFYP
jgi:hypothetical protein